MRNVYLNGDYIPLDEAKVSVLDRGFIFGDGVYEVLPAYRNEVLALDRHLHRLAHSLVALGIENPLSTNGWLEVLTRVLETNAGTAKSLYIQVTRGVAERDHVLRGDPRPTVFVMCTDQEFADPKPVSAIVRDDIRWQRCNVKATSLLANVLLRREAEECGAYEAILVRDGFLTEGAASNVFIVKDGVIKTPPHSEQLLPGVTRDILVELLAEGSLTCQVAPVPETELRSADEVWLTSSTRDVLPVTKLDEKLLGEGMPGPIWSAACDLFGTHKRECLGMDT
jgi:D-alanine transaminase